MSSFLKDDTNYQNWKKRLIKKKINSRYSGTKKATIRGAYIGGTAGLVVPFGFGIVVGGAIIGGVAGGMIGAGTSVCRKVTDPSYYDLYAKIEEKNGEKYFLEKYIEFQFTNILKESFKGKKESHLFLIC